MKDIRTIASTVQSQQKATLQITDRLLEVLSSELTPGVEGIYGRVFVADGKYVFETLGHQYPIRRRTVRSSEVDPVELVVAIDLMDQLSKEPRVLRSWYVTRWGQVRTDTSLSNEDSIVFDTEHSRPQDMVMAFFQGVLDTLPTE